MANEKELCVQYETFLALLKNGHVNELIQILENAIKRIDKGMTPASAANDNSSDNSK